MADNKTAATTKKTTDEFAIANFLPEGVSLEDLESVGGLVPILAAEFAFNGKDAVTGKQGILAAGYLVGWHEMPPRLAIEPAKKKAGIKEPWWTVYMRVTRPTTAKAGEEIVTVQPGEFVRIPVTGNLMNNDDLRLACLHPEKVFFGILRVKGQVELEKGLNAMWDYDVQISKDKGSKLRKSDLSFAFSEGPAKRLGAAYAPAGELGDVRTADGKPAGKLVENTAAA